MQDVLLKRFESADEERTFPKGKFEVVRLGDVTLGRATYEPGWKWSEHVGAATGTKLCQVAHVGVVVSGRAAVHMQSGELVELKAGDSFYVAPGHDSWVVGDEPYVSLHIQGADEYARSKSSAK